MWARGRVSGSDMAGLIIRVRGQVITLSRGPGSAASVSWSAPLAAVLDTNFPFQHVMTPWDCIEDAGRIEFRELVASRF